MINNRLLWTNVWCDFKILLFFKFTGRSKINGAQFRTVFTGGALGRIRAAFDFWLSRVSLHVLDGLRGPDQEGREGGRPRGRARPPSVPGLPGHGPRPRRGRYSDQVSRRETEQTHYRKRKSKKQQNRKRKFESHQQKFGNEKGRVNLKISRYEKYKMTHFLRLIHVANHTDFFQSMLN